jgi:hypothetical protein
MAVIDPTKKDRARKLFPEINERELDCLIAFSSMKGDVAKKHREKVRPNT